MGGFVWVVGGRKEREELDEKGHVLGIALEGGFMCEF